MTGTVEAGRRPEDGRTAGARGTLEVSTPEDAEGVARVLAAARADGVGVQIRGAGGIRPPLDPERPFRVLSTERLGGIHEYEPGDLTFTAGAGTRLEELEARLSEHGQWLPLDPPGGGARTLGGVVASGRSGPLQAGFGTVRDQVLGLTVVTGDGRVLRLGGRVMKNVAGFDLVRGFVGSEGRLGVIVRASLRVFPTPRGRRVLVLGDGGAPEGALAAARAVATASVVPASAVLLRGGELTEATLVVRLLGPEAVLDADQETLEGAVGGAFQVADDPDGWVRRLRDHGWSAVDPGDSDPDTGAEGVLRSHGLPSTVPDRWLAATTVAPSASVHADVLGGTLRLGVRAASADDPGLDALRQALAGGEGSLRVLRVPTSWRPSVRRWDGPSEGARRLERRLETAFDPHGVLAPARYGA